MQRQPTVQTQTVDFVIEGTKMQNLCKGEKIQLVDIGGKSAERNKWEEALEGATGIVYVIALSEYDVFR